MKILKILKSLFKRGETGRSGANFSVECVSGGVDVEVRDGLVKINGRKLRPDEKGEIAWTDEEGNEVRIKAGRRPWGETGVGFKSLP